MLIKVLIVAVLAVGVLGKYEFGDKEQDLLKGIIRASCKNNNAEDKSEQAAASLSNFINCVQPLFNYATIKNEVEEARPKNQINEVIKKYCAKTPELKICTDAFIDGLYPCLSTSIRGNIDADKNATKQLINVFCDNDGEKLALFIKEGGPECLKERDESFSKCVMKAQESANEDVNNVTVEMACGRFSRTCACAQQTLKECPSQTPYNVAENFFTYIKANSPCRNV